MFAEAAVCILFVCALLFMIAKNVSTNGKNVYSGKSKKSPDYRALSKMASSLERLHDEKQISKMSQKFSNGSGNTNAKISRNQFS